MTEAIKTAIDAGDVDALRALVAADRALADADVRFGPDDKHAVPPLHYVCDAVFRKAATQEQGLAMADVLLAAGVDPERAYAASGDTFLIAAASLGAQLVGLRLVERGVDVHPRGLFGATALHWSAHLGLDRLAEALANAGSDLELADAKYDCTPLEWTLHAWSSGTYVDRAGLPRVARVLVGRGARIPDGALEGLTGEGDAPLRAALGGAD